MALPLRDDLATRHVPWVTFALIAINVVVFLFIQPAAFQWAPPAHDHSVAASEKRLDAERFSGRWGAIPCEVVSGRPLADHPRQCEGSGDLPPGLPGDKPVYLALVTSMFVHGGLEHLGGNMLFLWVFGNNVEDRLGRLGFLVFYLAGGVVAALGFIAVDVHGSGPLIGASGAIAAVMGAYLAFHPRGRVLTAITVAPIQLVYVPAFVVLALFFGTQFLTRQNGVAWQAHAAGMAGGFLVALGLARLPAVRARARADHADLALRGGQSF
jgi:membrane associated rhomboid family serine protease